MQALVFMLNIDRLLLNVHLLSFMVSFLLSYTVSLPV